MRSKAEHGRISAVENLCQVRPHGARSVLRSETRDLHLRAEATLGRKPFRDLPSYACMLRANLAVTEAVSRAAGPLLQKDLTEGIAADAVRLRADLADLREPIIFDHASLELRDFPSAMGAIYVMEGARLGGKHLARQVETDLGLSAERGAAYLNGEGKVAGLRWRRFLAALEERIASEEDIARAVTAARKTFLLVILHYGRL